MARSRRVLAILPRIGAKFGNSTPTDLHHDVFGLGKVVHLAPGILGKWGASAHSPTGASMAWSHTNLAMSTANDDLSTTQPLWRVPLTRTLVLFLCFTSASLASVSVHKSIECSCVAVSYTHLRAHETLMNLVCRLLLEKKKPEFCF